MVRVSFLQSAHISNRHPGRATHVLLSRSPRTAPGNGSSTHPRHYGSRGSPGQPGARPAESCRRPSMKNGLERADPRRHEASCFEHRDNQCSSDPAKKQKYELLITQAAFQMSPCQKHKVSEAVRGLHAYAQRTEEHPGSPFPLCSLQGPAAVREWGLCGSFQTPSARPVGGGGPAGL